MDIRDEGVRSSTMRTTGWGLEIERLLCWLLKHDDVSDIAIIPRLRSEPVGTGFTW